MRTLILISVATLLTACSDNPQATAPYSIGSSTTGAAAGDRAPSVQGAMANAKPIDQVGLTNTTIVMSQTTLAANTWGGGAVTCPAGTVLTGGGYSISLAAGASVPTVVASMPYDNGAAYNAWSAVVRNQQAGSADVLIKTYAVCAS